jgi:cyclohexanecarboxylate-CoA ligase
MAFDIWLPKARIEASRGLWPDRLPIDDLDAAVAAGPDRTAFVGLDSTRGREVRLTYGELGDRVDRIAAGLLDLGIGKGDVVAFQLPNWWEFTALFYACNRIGAVANPLMPIFRQRELRYMLGFAEARLVVVPAQWRGVDHVALVAEIRGDLPKLEHVLAVGGSAPQAFEAALLDRPPLSAIQKQKLAGARASTDEVV